MNFDWNRPAETPATPAPVSRLSDLLVTHETPPPPRKVVFPYLPPKLPRKSLRMIVERFLRERNIPYVNVDDAKRALFASAKLGSFHFVSYNKTGANWLIWAAQMRKQAKADMQEWEKVFGDGFIAVVAKESTSGELTFKKLNGEKVEIT